MAIAKRGSRKLRAIGFRFVSGRGILVLSIALAGAESGAMPAMAQPFGWLFGSPRARHVARPRHRPAAADVAEVPLPVPRPHFPGDPTPAAPSVAAVPQDIPASTPTPATVPLPPEKPAAVEAPANSESPKAEKSKSEAAQPEPPKSEVAAKPASVPFGPPSPPSAPLPPEKPPELQKPGGNPTVAPSGARLGEAPGQPAEDAGCPGRLKARDVEFEPVDIGPQPDSRCTVVQPVRLSGLTLSDGTKVNFPEKPRVACTTADAFSQFIRDLLAPLARGTYGATVTSVWTGPGLECRSRDHIFGAKLSAHGQGLAVDIAQLKLADGRMFEVGQPKSPADQGFETASRAGACGYFHTVLGPGSDSYHRTHWHFDLEVRGAKGDTKYCH